VKRITSTLSVASIVVVVVGGSFVGSAYGHSGATNAASETGAPSAAATAAPDPHAAHAAHSARQQSGGTPVAPRDLSATLASAQANATVKATSPAQLLQLLGERIVAKDLDGIIALHEPTAAVVNYDGSISRGHAGIRAMYIEWFKSDPVLTVHPLQTLITGGQPGPKGTIVNRTASIMGNYTLEQNAPDGTRQSFKGNFCDMVRQQPDGTWLYLQDNPYPPHH
jgi:ketosteroid isomerase-like protein